MCVCVCVCGQLCIHVNIGAGACVYAHLLVVTKQQTYIKYLKSVCITGCMTCMTDMKPRASCLYKALTTCTNWLACTCKSVWCLQPTSVHVLVYVYMYVYVYVYMCAHVCVYMRACAHDHVYVCARLHMIVCACIQVHFTTDRIHVATLIGRQVNR